MGRNRDGEVHRITASLPQELIDDLHYIARCRGISVNRALMDAIVAHRYIVDTVASGGTMLVKRPNQKLRPVVFAE